MYKLALQAWNCPDAYRLSLKMQVSFLTPKWFYCTVPSVFPKYVILQLLHGAFNGSLQWLNTSWHRITFFSWALSLGMDDLLVLKLQFKLGTNHPETGTRHGLFHPRHLQKEKYAHEWRKELRMGVGNLSCNWWYSVKNYTATALSGGLVLTLYSKWSWPCAQLWSFYWLFHIYSLQIDSFTACCAIHT